MTPLDFARNLAQSDNPNDRVLGAAIVARGLSDDDPATFKQGWEAPTAAGAALRYLGLPVDDGSIEAVLEKMPTISDAMLNKGASNR